MNRIILVFFSVFIVSLVNAQKNDYSQYNLHSPLDIPLILAGNFGELRSNHFHTGIDIKTNRQIGYNIFSAEDGYVSRIRVSPWGYGHVVYIDHYNGLTTVYAHLDRFVGELADLALDQQRKNVGFSIDYYPTKDSLKVKRGQVLAKSGNTGGSTAPHLHFEIRETETEDALNPLLFGFDIADTKPPHIRELKVYGVSPEGYRNPGKNKRMTVHGSNGNYSISGNTFTVPGHFISSEGGIALAFEVTDQLDAANNICGIHEATLIIDGDTMFYQNMERISFESNRYINSHKDYEEYHSRRRHYHKAFKTKHNPLPIYPLKDKNGILYTEPFKEHQVNYIVKDSYGNTSKLNFKLEITANEASVSATENKTIISPDSAFISYDENHYILFPPGLLYEPTEIKTTSQVNRIQFGNTKTPLQESYKLMLPVKTPTEHASKAYIQRSNGVGRYSERGKVKDGWITTRTRFFGTFSVEIDTIAPVIRNRNFSNGSNVRGKQLNWHIEESGSGLESYNIYIDGEWHLLKYEPKDRLFFFEADRNLTGEKEVLIRAIDAVGNQSEAIYKLNF